MWPVHQSLSLKYWATGNVAQPPFQGRIEVSEGPKGPTPHEAQFGKETTQSWPKYTKIPLVVMGEVTIKSCLKL